ncbi:MAG: hypothetical protein QXJ27_06980 [Thermoplasmata archaeon]
MRKKTSKKREKKVSGEMAEDEEFEGFSELVAMAEDFGTDIETIGEHFEKFLGCGILQAEPDDGVLSPDFKEEVYQKMAEVDAGEITAISQNSVDADEIRLMEAIGYITLERFLDHGLLDLKDEKNLEQEFEKIMKSMLFILYLSGEFDAMLEKCGEMREEKTKKQGKKGAPKKGKRRK